MKFPIVVCGVEEVPQMTIHGPKRMVSLLEPGLSVQSPPTVEDRLALTMLDISNASVQRPDAPCLDHVHRLLTFGARAPVETQDVTLVCCRAGISRSTAAALILVAQRYGADRLSEAVDWLLLMRPEADPNTRLLMLADQALQLPGSLMRAGQVIKKRQRAARGEWI